MITYKSQSRKIFFQRATPHQAEEVFIITKVKDAARRAYMIDLTGMKLLERFMKKNSLNRLKKEESKQTLLELKK